jgi:hypothetical protein
MPQADVIFLPKFAYTGDSSWLPQVRVELEWELVET